MIDAVELTSAMDGAGVALAIVCGWPWLDPGLCREHNDYLAAASQREQRSPGLARDRGAGVI